MKNLQFYSQKTKLEWLTNCKNLNYEFSNFETAEEKCIVWQILEDLSSLANSKKMDVLNNWNENTKKYATKNLMLLSIATDLH